MIKRMIVKEWLKTAFYFSPLLSYYSLITLLYFNPRFKTEWVYKRVEKKHEYILKYLKNKYGQIIEKYETKEEECEKSEKKYIWTLWWQGMESAPELVKICIASMKRHSGDAEVVVLDKNNFTSYVSLPSYIMKKFKKGIISLQQLTDITRAELISSRGGVWLDATIYVSKDIPEYIFSLPFYSLHTKERKTPFVQNDIVHLFVFGGRKNSNISLFTRDFLLHYWQDHSAIIDYYLLDYSLMLQYLNIEKVMKYIGTLPLYEGEIYALQSMLEGVFDKEKCVSILSDTLFSKLNWNKRYGKDNKTLQFLSEYAEE